MTKRKKNPPQLKGSKLAQNFVQKHYKIPA